MVLDRVRDELTGTIAVSWLKQRSDDSSLVDKVVLVLAVDPVGAGRDQYVTALRSIEAAAPTMTLDQAQRVLRAISVRARQPVNPYADAADRDRCPRRGCRPARGTPRSR